MNVSARVYIDAETVIKHDVYPPVTPAGEPVVWLVFGDGYLPDLKIGVHDVAALERLAGQCKAAARALHKARLDQVGAA